MQVRVAATGGMPTRPAGAGLGGPEPDLLLDWSGPRRNARFDSQALRAQLRRPLPPRALDLLDVAASIYLTDIAVQRGQREEWVRDIHLTIPVRDLAFWQDTAELLRRLLYRLAGDRFQLEYQQLSAQAPDLEPALCPLPAELGPVADADCVSLLSGGIDSLAGAVALLRTGRRPHFVLHCSGNPTTRRAQDHVIGLLRARWPGACRFTRLQVAPDTSLADGYPYPPAPLREPSRRARSLLFLALGVVTACGEGVSEVYVCENGFLTAAIPLTDARPGSFSTASTHPQTLSQVSALCAQAGLAARLLNPFAYQTKAQLITDILRPELSPPEIQRTVSCWSAGRQPRQCGGCVPCLIRRVAMLAAGLPDEAYETDLLGEPLRYRGSDAFANLMDLLSQAAAIRQRGDVELLLEFPALLDSQAWGVSVPDLVTMLRRHSDEIYGVAMRYFPETARFLVA